MSLEVNDRQADRSLNSGMARVLEVENVTRNMSFNMPECMWQVLDKGQCNSAGAREDGQLRWLRENKLRGVLLGERSSNECFWQADWPHERSPFLSWRLFHFEPVLFDSLGRALNRGIGH